MVKLSIEKMKEIKKTSGLTNKDIADKTNISVSTITKLFGGFQVNPSIEAISKIAEALNCGVDDFFDWGDAELTSPYYIDRKTAEIAQDLAEKPELNAALKAMRDLPPDDIKFVQEFIERLKKQ